MRVSSWLPLLAASLVLIGCAGPVTSSRRANGFHVECIHRASCEARAAKVCRGSFRVQGERRNPIPDHELPGFNQHPTFVPPQAVGGEFRNANERTVAESLAGPSATAREPLPLVELDVVCGSSS